MAGYTRNDTSNNIATGNVINAADLDGEFDALVAAFHASTGHTHDGTAANGAPITKIGPAQDLVISTGAITPKTDNTVDLGSSSFEFKDLYIDGTANIDALVADTADINAGTIDGVTLGTNSAVTEAQIDNININGNTISSTDTNGNISLVPNGTGDVILTADTIQVGDSNTDVTVTTNGTGDLIFNTNAGTNSGVIRIYDGANGNIALTPNGTGEVDISKVDIDSGAIDGTAIGANSASTGAFTTLSASSTVTLSGGTANGVLYLNGSKVATSGSALTFDGTNFTFQSAISLLNNDGSGNKAVLTPFAYGGSGATGTLVLSSTYGNANQQRIRVGVGGAAAISFDIDTTEAMRLTSTGLGIGTSSPAHKLDVATSSGDCVIRLGNGTSQARFALDSDGPYIYPLTSGDLSLRIFTASGSQAFTLDSSGNLGLGVTPSAWGGSFKALQIGAGLSLYDNGIGSGTFLGANYFYNGTNNIYINSTFATAYGQSAGVHAWYTAPSGTAGNTITFTQAMTLDASGRLGIGTTSPSARVAAYGSVDANFGTIYCGDTASASVDVGGVLALGGYKTSTTSESIFAKIKGGKENGTAGNEAGYLAFFTNNNTTYVERARITSGGVFQIANGGAINLTTTASGNGNISFDGSTFTIVSNSSSAPLVFSTNSTERARITSGGDLLVGATSSPSSSVAGTLIGNSGPGGRIALANTITTTYQGVISFTNGNGTVGTIDTSGSSTSYVTSSDYRLKNTITPMTGALAKVALLKPCTYKWNVDGSDGEGFIAHELAEVCPQAVSGEKDAVDAEGNPQYQGIDTSFLVATLTAAIQEQQALITSLTARVALLEGN